MEWKASVLWFLNFWCLKSVLAVTQFIISVWMMMFSKGGLGNTKNLELGGCKGITAWKSKVTYRVHSSAGGNALAPFCLLIACRKLWTASWPAQLALECCRVLLHVGSAGEFCLVSLFHSCPQLVNKISFPALPPRTHEECKDTFWTAYPACFWYLKLFLSYSETKKCFKTPLLNEGGGEIA